MSEEIPKSIKSDQTLILDKPPCCLEFFPNNPAYFVVGTYNLISPENQNEAVPSSSESTVGEKQQRDGSLVVCRLVEDRM